FEREVLLAHLPLEQVPTLIEGVLTAASREPLPDLVPGSRRRAELHPILARSLPLRLRRQDLDGVARAQLVVQRDELAVHFGTDRAVTDLGVDRAGERHRAGALRQGLAER